MLKMEITTILKEVAPQNIKLSEIVVSDNENHTKKINYFESVFTHPILIKKDNKYHVLDGINRVLNMINKKEGENSANIIIIIHIITIVINDIMHYEY